MRPQQSAARVLRISLWILIMLSHLPGIKFIKSNKLISLA